MQNNLKNCPVQITLNVIGGKWKPIILYYLKENSLRFNELLKQLNGITQKMLTLQLRQLEHDGLIKRKVYPQIPPKVEYSITAYGRTLQPILKSMCEWGLKHRNRR